MEVEVAPTEDEEEDVVLEVVVAEVRDRTVIGELRITKVIKTSHSNLLIPNHQTQLVQTLGHQPLLQLQAVHFHQTALKISKVSNRCYII